MGRVVLLGTLAVLIGGMYWPTVVELVAVWSTDPNYSHGFAVPLFALYLAWSAAKEGGPCQAGVPGREAVLGFLQVLLGLGLHLCAAFAGQLLLDVLALICLVRGSLLVLGGSAANQRFGLAALFLVFMARLPIKWHQALAGSLQELASQWSCFCFEACGIPVLREGYRLYIPGYTLEVGEACSGIRQLTTALALGAAVGYLLTRRNRYVWLVALAGIPVAVVANCVRVILSGFAVHWWGRDVAEGLLHTLEGVLTMALASLLLVGLAWGLARWDRARQPALVGTM
jgi:exosortase